MRFRTTLVLFALTAALVVFIKFYETKRPNTEEANRRAQNVINFERDKIDGIVIQNGEERIELKRADKKWRLESPVKDLADGSTIDGLLFDLEDWKKDATISGKEIEADKSRMAEYGVAKAKLRLKLQGANAPPEILFGNNAALEGKTYVRLENSKDVFLAAQSIKNQISKKPEEFRDRKLTDTVATQVTRLSLKTAAGEMELQKQGDHWQIVKPLRARADDQKVNDLIAQITTSRIAQFVADDAGDLHPYALTEPRGTVTIFTADDKQGQILQIGGVPEKEKDQVYVRFAPRKFVYTLPNKIETILSTRPNDLRDRHLVRFDQNQLDRITIDVPGKTKTVLARKDQNWTIVNRNNRPANAAEARRLIDLLAGEQVTNFVADVASDLPKYGLDKPQLTVTLSSFASENTAETKAGEHPLATIAFGKIDGENIFARVGEEPFVVAVHRSTLDNIFADPLQWQDLTIFKFKPEQIHRFALFTDHEQSLIRGPNNQWEWVTGNGPINTVAVQSLVNTLASLHAVRWLANVPPAAFDKPQLVATFTTSADDKAQHKVTISGPSADETSMARTDEHEGTFVISSSDLSALRGALVQPPFPSPAASASPSVATSPVAPPTP
ncbi:MAG: hypothetical protein DMF27_13605 [Verrucomicrobia bacterium]|nr:MAG: hypothetical protein DME37_08675 [Verrucomicrobiota bacterium]PYL74891.1 MAG: hypothetical protein DMF27_13605 [Verrucomicrobiota bacterium]PYM09881.1 MAG: hypothetical protein DMF15_04105 [Verrucomicrobiota bacterium]